MTESEAFDTGIRQLPGKVVLAIGADVIEVERIRQTIERQPSFVDRVYTSAEKGYCRRYRDPAERFAVRFAAKEAVLKTLGVGLAGADLVDIEVTRAETGRPGLRLTGRAGQLAANQSVTSWLITLTHSDTVAQAFVAALGQPADETGRT